MLRYPRCRDKMISLERLSLVTRHCPAYIVTQKGSFKPLPIYLITTNGMQGLIGVYYGLPDNGGFIVFPVAMSGINACGKLVSCRTYDVTVYMMYFEWRITCIVGQVIETNGRGDHLISGTNWIFCRLYKWSMILKLNAYTDHTNGLPKIGINRNRLLSSYRVPNNF